MSETSAARSVQCTQCGAPLDLHGGHKVRSLTCGYCGSQMDAHKDYQIIKAHQNTSERPLSPFKLGMQGKIKQVLFTLIGMVEYESEGERWLDFQLYSPTHGYAWLSQSQGHYSFTRRVRSIPTPSQVKQFKAKKTVRIKGKKLKLFEKYQSKITYVEGELTWIAKLGQSSKTVDAIAPPYGLSYESNGKELEYSWEEYLNRDELFQAFNLAPLKHQPSHVHPLQPYPEQGMWGAMEKIAPDYFLTSLFLLIIFWFFNSSSTILEYQHTSADLSIKKTFEIKQKQPLLKLNLIAQPSKKNTWYEVDILDTQAKNVFSLKKALNKTDIGQYSHWSQDAADVDVWLRLPAGIYTLYIHPRVPVATTSAKAKTPSKTTRKTLPPLSIRLSQEGIPLRFVLYFVLLSLLLLFIASYKRVSFEQNRWQD